MPGKSCPARHRWPAPGAQAAVARSRRQEDRHRMAQTATVPAETEDFAALLDATLGTDSGFDGSVITGRIVRIEGDSAVIDVGLKSEGRVPLKEFAAPGQKPEIKPGDLVDVYVERYEDRDGSIILSREKARREEAWTNLEKAFQAQARVNGVIFGRVKGGFTVDLGGAVAFLPGSQVDIRPVRDVGPLMGTPQPFQILKMDRSRGNIVVSRRAVLEETRAEQRAELVQGLKEGQILDGVVKNITDYGAFVDLGGVDGLLHVTDIAWRRINHPSEALQVGQTVKVQVIRFNPETQRISLGMKQLMADPWDGVTAKYPVGAKFTGRVTNITDYGAFVELEPGVEGLVHVSEMSWTKKNVHPGKIVSTSQEVEVMVLDVDGVKRRISLGLKQCLRNPWEEFLEKHPVGSTVQGEVRNITEFGLFIGLPGDIDGMVHLSDLAWDQPGEVAIQKYSKGDMVEAKVLDVDVEKERISLGIKQLTSDPAAGVLDRLQKGQVVTGIVTAVQGNGIEVKVDDTLTGFIRKADLARDKQDQRPDRFGVGDKVDAKIIAIERATRRLSLSIKAREMEEEKQAMAEFGSSDSGASLGDILGAAIRRRNQMASEGKE
ncbi:30S ribosomal protein S1 [Elioraea tepidiphila]|uniref:30S ribosomal protein S1 n=1 Tax=Elioraea tepidiphila TaxID=457934 RepID=UPI00248061D6|nr:30S ribosomal protein S1 [Elioraea tepidiphila]